MWGIERVVRFVGKTSSFKLKGQLFEKEYYLVYMYTTSLIGCWGGQCCALKQLLLDLS
jgi:hypothetical protein